MSLILFVIGAVLYFTQRVNLGKFRTEGHHVRAAGIVLMFPAAFTFLLSLFAGLIFASNLDALPLVFRVLAFVEISTMILAAMITYILVAAPAGAPRLPGILGHIQNEGHNAPSAQRHAPEPFPSIMSIAQAARYVKMSEAEIQALIDASQLGAARINNGYRIARRSLDELLEARETPQTR